MNSGITIAVFPPTLAPGSGDAEADLARGIACFLERRLRVLPNVTAQLQQLVFSTAQEPDVRRWLPTPRLWTVDEATSLPVPPGFEPSHILQGILDRRGEQLSLTLELVDLQVHEVAFHREVHGNDETFIPAFFAVLHDLASILVHEGDATEALEALGTPPTLNHKAFSLFLHGLSGTLARRLHVAIPEPAAAFRQFLDAMEADPQFEEAASALNGLGRGWILNHDGPAEIAINALEQAARLFQHHLPIKETLGHAYFERGRLVEARQYLKEFARHDRSPHAADALVRLADIENQTGHRDKAIELLHTALRREPEHIAALERIALHHMEGGRPGDAEHAWRRILDVLPTYPLALSRLAEIHATRGQLSKAAILYERSVEGDSPSPEVYFRCVRFFIDRNDFARADTLATQWVETQPEHFRAWLTLSGVRGRLGQREACEHSLRKAEELAVTPAQRVELSSLRFAMRHPADARLFEKLIDAENNTRPASNEEMLARRDAIRRLCETHPEVVALWHMQVRLCQRVDDLDGAIAAQRRILEILPGEASMHNTLGSLLVRAARPRDAVDAFAAAVAHAPGNLDYLANLATAQLDAGDLDACKTSLAALNALSSDHPALARLTAQLTAREESQPEPPGPPAGFMRRLLAFFGKR